MSTHKFEVDLPKPGKVDMALLWEESMQDDDFQFEIKAQSLSVDLIQAVAEKGISQKQLAEKLGWSASRVSRVLHGGSNVTIRTLCEIASALGVEFDVIFRDKEMPKAPHFWQVRLMLGNAMEVCKKIEEMQKNVEKNLSESQSILQTARDINRKSWNRGRAMSITSDRSIKFDLMAA